MDEQHNLSALDVWNLADNGGVDVIRFSNGRVGRGDWSAQTKVQVNDWLKAERFIVLPAEPDSPFHKLIATKPL
jgi:hypothetical protein